MDKKHYPYASEEDRQKKKDVAYIVFNLDKEQTEEVFASYSWHTKNLDLKQGHLQAEPHYMSLAELVKRRDR